MSIKLYDDEITEKFGIDVRERKDEKVFWVYSLVCYFTTIAIYLLDMIIVQDAGIMFIIFPFMVIEIIYLIVTKNNEIDLQELKRKNCRILYPVVLSSSIGVISSVVGMFILRKGGTEIIDGKYYVVNHGEIIQESTSQVYWF